ncbi:MAG: pyruvate kinase [Anaerovoracaceae bacterium]|jgi:pyruvate kinase
MRKTKIVCTLGPATDRNDNLREIMLAGMNVARFNFSHGTHEEHKQRLTELDKLRRELDLPVATMLDTKGPEIRLRDFQNGEVELKAGQNFTLTTDKIEGDETRCSITYENLPADVTKGDTILLDDGLVKLTVLDTDEKNIVCNVENDGVMKNHKGVNVPNVTLNMPYMSPQDRSDILFGIEEGFDFISASFVRSAADVREIRDLLNEHHSDIRIISKIENRTGIANIASILDISDGIMVARGDMGVEIDFTDIPAIQKSIIDQCAKRGKPVITATQMLDSMIENPRPTRAEITDVANAIYDGTSAIMLSGETAAGKFPVEAVQTMDAIAKKTESNIVNNVHRIKANNGQVSITQATAHAACQAAEDIGADAILTVSKGGSTAQSVSSFRPQTPIVALMIDERVRRKMSLYWGITPLIMPNANDSDELVDLAIQTAEDAGLVHHGDLVVTTAGVPVGVSGTTNMIRVTQVGGSLINAIGIGDQVTSGSLCICHNQEEIDKKFHAGDILVVPYVSRDMIPAIKDAAGLITEDASPDGNAVTIGITLNKPVIIDAIHAMQYLTDGTVVTMDCRRGVVRLLPGQSEK